MTADGREQGWDTVSHFFSGITFFLVTFLVFSDFSEEIASATKLQNHDDVVFGL